MDIMRIYTFARGRRRGLSLAQSFMAAELAERVAPAAPGLQLGVGEWFIREREPAEKASDGDDTERPKAPSPAEVTRLRRELAACKSQREELEAKLAALEKPKGAKA